MRAVLLMLSIPAAVLTAATVSFGQVTGAGVCPATIAPGATTRVEFRGRGLTEGFRVVTADPQATVSSGPGNTEASTAPGEIAVGADAIGPLEVWPTTAAGPAAMCTLVVDDLPVVVAHAGVDASSTDQVVTIPTCIDGMSRAGQPTRFRFQAKAGQRVAIEALSSQIGSPLDPVVRLLDTSGRVLAQSDDGPAGLECCLAHVVDETADYLVELAASDHAGWAPYHLRIGDFPIVSHAMPLAVQRGSTTRVRFGGRDATTAETVEVHVPEGAFERGRLLATRLPGGRSSAWVPVLVHEVPQVVEPPPTTLLPIPVGVSGRLEAPGERDVYRLQGRAGETIRVVTRGRSLGCATVPRLRLVDAAGKVVAGTATSQKDQDPAAAILLEPQLSFTFATDGEHRLEVDDLARRGGADFGYFFALESTGADVELKPDQTAKLAFAIEPGEGCAPLDLVVKRFGFDGEITLSLAEPLAGVRVVNPVIPAKATQARVYLAADEGWRPESVGVVRLVADVAGKSPKPVSTEAVRAVQGRSFGRSSPVGDGCIVLAGVPGGQPRYQLVPAGPVVLTRGRSKHEFPLALTRLDPEFKGPVAIDGCLLPPGFAATGTMSGDTCIVSVTGTSLAGSEPATLRLLAVATVDQRTTIRALDVAVTWTDAPAAVPAEAGGQDAGTPAPGFASGYAGVVASMKPRVATLAAKTADPLRARGEVQIGETGVAAFTNGRLDGSPPPLGASWSVSLWFMNRLAVDARPVTAYLFSRGTDGECAGGDHLGIGGSYQPELPGKLLVFNGNSRNSLVFGRTILRPAEWHHVVLVRDGKRIRAFLDGATEPEIDAELEPTAAEEGGYFLGARADRFAPLQGAMTHVAVFDRPLTAAEARLLHAAAFAGGVTPEPVPGKNGDPQPVATAVESSPTAAAPASTPRSLAAPAATFGPGLHVHPPEVLLDGAGDRQQLAITTVDEAGFPCDWTRTARVVFSRPGIASLRGTTLFPLADGTTEAIVEAGGRRQAVAIAVRNASVPRPIQFENEVMVALSKQSCSSGACHGSPSGKGGFRLSLRASDKDLDLLTITREEFGRRINPLEPDASLLLSKPLMQVPHGGGKQLSLSDEAAGVIRAWIVEGGRADPAGTPRCVRLEVSPAGRQVQRLGEGGRQLVSTAHFSDGSRRDVTHLVAYESSAAGVATVDARGWVTPRKRGEVVILVRYLEHIAVVPLMFIEQVPGSVWRARVIHNDIDRLVDEKLRALDYPPAEVCGDSEFVRRVHLDVIGLLPTVEQTERFLADPSADKRNQLIDQLLEREEYARVAALRWGDILRLSKKRAGPQGVYKYHRWLEDAFRTNKPHDQFARELLLATGSSFSNPPAHFFRTPADSNETVETVVQLFLGVRLQCAKCHNHPFDRWSQDNYYGLTAFFDRVRKRPAALPDEVFVYAVTEGDTRQPRTGKVVKPWLPLVGEIDVPRDTDPREAFVTWLLSPDNPSFARVEANRIWSQFFSRGIVHPVDEFRDSNPPSNGPLLDWLAAEFSRSGFDRKHLIRTILRSRTYQAASTAATGSADDVLYFSHHLPRRLTAEQLLDAIGEVTGVQQPLGPLPAGSKATGLPAPDVATHAFLKLLGQPDRGTVCACERSEDSSLGMAIELFNGRLITASLADPASSFRKALAAGDTPERIIRRLYLAALCRPPTPGELAAAVVVVEAAADPAAGVEDVCWALLNSDEFVFQH